MKHEFKSLESYLADLVSELDLNILAPSIDYSLLRTRLNEIFGKDNNPFWVTSEFGQRSSDYQDWLFFEVRSFIDKFPTTIAIQFQDRYLNLYYFDDLNGRSILEALREGKITRTEIYLVDAWVDHSLLFEKISAVFIEAVKNANEIGNSEGSAEN